VPSLMQSYQLGGVGRLLRLRLGSNGAEATWPSNVKLEDFSAIRLRGRAYEIERNGARHGRLTLGWVLFGFCEELGR
jgi:hypothetical protein